jgi:hypothetical protein
LLSEQLNVSKSSMPGRLSMERSEEMHSI